MNRSSLALTMLLTLAAGASPVLVRNANAWQQSRLSRIMAALPEPAARELERAIADAREHGLPTTPLVDKALEGTAKGVPADQILLVVHDLAGQLGRARELVAVAGVAPDTDIAAVAEALRRGVPEDAVRSLRGEMQEASIALAVHTLADLLDRGVPVDQALEVLGAWRTRGARPEALRDLPAAVERLIREGALPAQAAAAVATSVRSGEGPPAGLPPGLASPPGKGKAKGKAKGKGKGNGKGKGKGNGPGGPPAGVPDPQGSPLGGGFGPATG